ncbi:lipid-A-disaccharide synthase [Candidatus Erwinia haradaeae]|uniref:Lipid-A-disaccharide synthase n=1 Tax=Candidatus Erwinia haradaeae TaxID=1922217 RepID=A0A451D7Y8_9GAMM|nr:lipid-A-disaccharide synthase [Candidatus Erwinia haradaeae]VFP81875.1 Lipid-A-disaccharide synthase [Candidatus Erwinia haradaeae]
MSNNILTIALVAGEISGDMLGAGLMRAIKEKHANVRFIGVAGPLMKSEGCLAWYDMEELEVMGVVEIVGRLRRLLYIRRDLTRRLILLQPDVFIGIDSPDFNLTLEGRLKRKGIRTIHYVSPSLWAWRQKRIVTIGRVTDLVLVLLPFEKALYDRWNVSCCFIGHPMADLIPIKPDKLSIREELGIDSASLCLALLPGSRSAEVDMLSEDFLKTAIILQEKYPNLQVIAPLVNTQRRLQFKRIKDRVAPKLQVHFLDGKGSLAMQASDVALLASGTATLECMLAKCPMVVSYRMKPFTFWLAKRLVKTSYVSLPNLLSNSTLVPELLQEKCQPQHLAAALDPFLINPKICPFLLTTFTELHQTIRQNSNENAAKAVLELCK